MSLRNRVSKLEDTHAPSRRMFVVGASHGAGEDETLMAVGIDPAASDLVVFVTRFGNEIGPRLVSVEGMMA